MHDSSLWRALIGVENTVIEGVEYDAGARTLVVAARPAAQRRCGFVGRDRRAIIISERRLRCGITTCRPSSQASVHTSTGPVDDERRSVAR